MHIPLKENSHSSIRIAQPKKCVQANNSTLILGLGIRNTPL